MRAEEPISLDKNNSPHLTTEQLGGLLDAELSGVVGEELRGASVHLQHCAECSAEVEGLREALTLFRESTSAYADRQLAAATRERVRAARDHSFAHRPLWPRLSWVAAGLLGVSAVLPLRWHMEQKASENVQSASVAPITAQKPESDAALLDDISRELSASVPEPMQALADPDSSATNAYPVSTRTNQP